MLLSITFILPKVFSRFYEACYSLRLSVALCRHPMLGKLIFINRITTFARVTYVKALPSAVNLIQNHEMVLIPMQNARQRYLS